MMAALHQLECQAPAQCPLCGAPEGPRLLVAHIQHMVAAYYGIPAIAMVSAQRGRRWVWPRQMAMFLAREMTPQSLPDIGRRFGFRDHTTVMHAAKAVSARIEDNAETARDYLILRDRLLDGDEG
jgi:chromosomal replication initiator protein